MNFCAYYIYAHTGEDTAYENMIDRCLANRWHVHRDAVPIQQARATSLLALEFPRKV